MGQRACGADDHSTCLGDIVSGLVRHVEPQEGGGRRTEELELGNAIVLRQGLERGSEEFLEGLSVTGGKLVLNQGDATHEGAQGFRVAALLGNPMVDGLHMGVQIFCSASSISLVMLTILEATRTRQTKRMQIPWLS
jgi:hypothetical protein